MAFKASCRTPVGSNIHRFWITEFPGEVYHQHPNAHEGHGKGQGAVYIDVVLGVERFLAAQLFPDRFAIEFRVLYAIAGLGVGSITSSHFVGLGGDCRG